VSGGIGASERSGWAISVETPRAADVRELLLVHLEFSRAQTPPEFVFALDADGLGDERVTLFALRDGGELLGIAALNDLGDGDGELKSMHTARAARGRGVARALLEHVLRVAAERGLGKLSVETGTQPAFAPARALYESAGFEYCGPFGDYPDSGYSAFMTRKLDPR
jgi:putative acetyltransferase